MEKKLQGGEANSNQQGENLGSQSSRLLRFSSGKRS